MHDPFPFPPPAWLIQATRPLTNALGLPVLNLHIHEVLLSALAYHVICTVISPVLSRAIFPKAYSRLSESKRLNWDIHFTSLFQSTMISIIGMYHITFNLERKAMDWRDRVWSYDGGLGILVALATGYFVWDLCISTYHVKSLGLGSLAHALSALAVYGFGFRPMVNYYAPVFILFELSTPFLNFHWFFDKLDMTGSEPQLYNGIALMATFFGARLVWGTYSGFSVFPDLLKAMQYQDTAAGQAWLAQGAAATAVDAAASAASGDVSDAARIMYTAPRYLPQWICGVYLGSYCVLMLLNVHWFGRMIQTIRTRFDPPLGTRVAGKDKNVVVHKVVSADGVNSVEVDATEVRQRRSRKV